MTIRTHLSRDYSVASASRRQRACYHATIKRLYDEKYCRWTETWVCECGFVMSERISAVNQKENTNADLRENQRV